MTRWLVALIMVCLLGPTGCANLDLDEPVPAPQFVRGTGYNFQVPGTWKDTLEPADDLDVSWGDCSNRGCVPSINVIAQTYKVAIKAKRISPSGLAALQRDLVEILAEGGIRAEPHGFEDFDGVSGVAVFYSRGSSTVDPESATVLVPNNATKMYYTITVQGSYWRDKDEALRMMADTWEWD